MNVTATLFGQALTFGVLVWFLTRYLWGPMTQMMQARAARIANGLEAAERSKHELELAKQHAADSLRAAKQQAAEVIAGANKQATVIIDQAKEQARIEGQRQLDVAVAEIEQEKSRARQELRTEVVSLALATAEKILAREINPSVHGEYLDNMLKGL